MTQQLGCPSCKKGDGLFVIETVELERRVPDVTTDHVEYSTLETERLDSFNEIGVHGEYCDFRHIGDDWRGVLVPIGVVNENP